MEHPSISKYNYTDWGIWRETNIDSLIQTVKCGAINKTDRKMMVCYDMNYLLDVFTLQYDIPTSGHGSKAEKPSVRSKYLRSMISKNNWYRK